MRIEVSRSGGVAGMTRRGVVDTATCADPSEWQQLVEQALPAVEPAPDPAPGVRDGFSWSISIVSTQIGTTRVELGDTQLAGPMRDLAERALREGGPRRT